MHCIFCGPTESSRAREHVIPDWMLNEFKWGGQYVQPTHFGIGGQIVSDRLHVMGNMRAGGVCKKCNSGWMSALEMSNKDTLIGLTAGTLALSDLEPDQCLALARWVAKTAYVLHFSSNFRAIVPAEHYRQLRNEEDALPSGVLVVGKQIERNDQFSWCQSTQWFLQARGCDFAHDEIKRVHDSAYKISLQLRALVVTVAFNPLADAIVQLVPSVHEVVFPRGAICGWYTYDRELPAEPMKFLFVSNQMPYLVREGAA